MTARLTFTALIVGTTLAAMPGSALAGGRPQEMPPAAYSALVAQGQALNARYGNAVTRLSSEQFNGLYNAGGSKLTPEALNALVVRGEALNKLSRQTTPMSPPPASPPTIASQSSFAWDDFGIGMAAAFGLILLTGGLAVAVRTGTRSRVGVPS